MAKRSVPPPTGPAFGWPGSVAVGLVLLAGSWVVTGSAINGAIGGLTAAVTWYAAHRLLAPHGEPPEERDG